jgi:hypothetical protein
MAAGASETSLNSGRATDDAELEQEVEVDASRQVHVQPRAADARDDREKGTCVLSMKGR